MSDASDVAAWWGAIVASGVLVWDVYKHWTSGPRLVVKVTTNMMVIGDEEDRQITWVAITVDNRGDGATTLTNIGGMQYDSELERRILLPN